MDKTPYYSLPLYETGSVANLRDSYNNSMLAIDKRLHQIDIQLQTLKNLKENEHGIHD